MNSKIKQCSKEYIKDLEEKIIQHCPTQCLYKTYVGDLPVKEKEKKVSIIDKEGKDNMKHVANICRKLKCCYIPFSPEASIRIRRAQVYYSIIKFHKEKIWNKSNLK